MRDDQRISYSRFQVLTEGQPAWAQDAQGSRFYFDGYCFWRRTKRGRSKLVTSWRSPHHGWEHESGCSCRLCVAEVGLNHAVA